MSLSVCRSKNARNICLFRASLSTPAPENYSTTKMSFTKEATVHWNFEIWNLYKSMYCEDLGESFEISMYYVLAKIGFGTAENEPSKIQNKGFQILIWFANCSQCFQTLVWKHWFGKISQIVNFDFSRWGNFESEHIISPPNVQFLFRKWIVCGFAKMHFFSKYDFSLRKSSSRAGTKTFSPLQSRRA